MNNQLLTMQVLSRSLCILVAAIVTTFSDICYSLDNHGKTVQLFIECSYICQTNKVCIWCDAQIAQGREI